MIQSIGMTGEESPGVDDFMDDGHKIDAGSVNPRHAAPL
jgi:hypothetical protein